MAVHNFEFFTFKREVLNFERRFLKLKLRHFDVKARNFYTTFQDFYFKKKVVNVVPILRREKNRILRILKSWSNKLKCSANPLVTKIQVNISWCSARIFALLFLLEQHSPKIEL